MTSYPTNVIDKQWQMIVTDFGFLSESVLAMLQTSFIMLLLNNLFK